MTRGLFQDEYRPTTALLTFDKWHVIALEWDCIAGNCRLLLDDEQVAVMNQLSRAPGICYLRTWMSAQAPEFAGLLIDSLETHVGR